MTFTGKLALEQFHHAVVDRRRAIAAAPDLPRMRAL
jgi:hypothetical protein